MIRLPGPAKRAVGTCSKTGFKAAGATGAVEPVHAGPVSPDGAKMLILDGKAVAARIRADLATEIAARGHSRPPGLAVILVGDNPASQVYVRNKIRACGEVGIKSFQFALPPDASGADLLALIADLNQRQDVDGILLQLPLPPGLDCYQPLLAIDPVKDVDGFHPLNMGALVLGLPCLPPCTPAGVLELLRHYGISLAGKKAVIVGRSDIVGKPLAMLLARKDINATVTLCHSGTKDLKAECLRADCLFLAMGRPDFVTGDMVRPGCVVVDIGISRTPDGLRGDADFASVSGKAAAITPVPGGVGPMTIAMLLRNAVSAWQRREGLGPLDDTLPPNDMCHSFT